MYVQSLSVNIIRFIHVIYLSCVEIHCMNLPWVIYSAADEHLSRFQFCVMISAALNILERASWCACSCVPVRG